MYRTLLIAALLLMQLACVQQKTVEEPAPAPQKPNPEWLNQKYSMFIHFGLYSQLGGEWKGQPVKDGYSEQIQSFAKIPKEEYMEVAKVFNPEKWNADEIVSLAKAAGMKSIVFTSKHHDGFCMYDTETTTYNIVDATPFKRDVMKELSDACHKQGVKFAVYFSLIDWNFPGNTITPHNADKVSPEHHKFSMQQVKEIMTNYGEVSEIWFDMGALSSEQSKELYDLVTSLQPQCMISGRLGNDRGDFSVMADNEIPDYKIGTPWQTAASFFDETWSYRAWQDRGNIDDKVNEKIKDMIKVISRGGNYLLNIGPRGDGSVVEFERDALLKMGEWIKRYGEAIYSTKANPFDHAPEWGDITCKGNDMFLFVEQMPENGVLGLNGVLGKVVSASLIADGSELQVKQDGQSAEVTLPAGVKPDCGIVVVKLQFDGEFKTLPDEIVKSSVLELKNAVPVYAYSSMDYYSTFRSMVGYTWHFASEATSVTPSIVYLKGNEGDEVSVEIDGTVQTMVLQGGEAQPLAAEPANVEWSDVSMWGPRYEIFRSRDPKPAESIKPIDVKWGEPVHFDTGDSEAIFVEHKVKSASEQDILVSFGVADGIRVMLNGETIAMRTYVGGFERKPETLKLHLKKGDNTLCVQLYNRYGTGVDYMIDPTIAQEVYSMPLPTFNLVDGGIHECKLGLANPANHNSDIGMRDVKIVL